MVTQQSGYGRTNAPAFDMSTDMKALTVADHTLIVGAVMTHPAAVTKHLALKQKESAQPSGQEVLKALLRVDTVDENVRARTRLVLRELPQIERAALTLPPTIMKAIGRLKRQMSGKAPRLQREVLLAALKDNLEASLRASIEVSAQVLADGLESIYSPDFVFYKMLDQKPSGARAKSGEQIMKVLSDVATIDALGGVAGGVVGLVVAGIGATAGGIVGAAGSSAGFALSLWT